MGYLAIFESTAASLDEVPVSRLCVATPDML